MGVGSPVNKSQGTEVPIHCQNPHFGSAFYPKEAAPTIGACIPLYHVIFKPPSTFQHTDPGPAGKGKWALARLELVRTDP
jgi:hypothetical protein